MRRIPFETLLAFAFVAGSLVACAAPKSSTNAPSANGPVRVGFVEYRTQQRLELVNASHTEPLEQYSQVRTNAGRKVQKDETVDALVEYFEDQGFRERAQIGPAPAASDGQLVWALELEDKNGTTHVEARKGQTSAELDHFKAMLDAFLQIYNGTYSLQAVDKKYWDTPEMRPAPKAKTPAGEQGGR